MSMLEANGIDFADLAVEADFHYNGRRLTELHELQKYMPCLQCFADNHYVVDDVVNSDGDGIKTKLSKIKTSNSMAYEYFKEYSSGNTQAELDARSLMNLTYDAASERFEIADDHTNSELTFTDEVRLGKVESQQDQASISVGAAGAVRFSHGLQCENLQSDGVRFAFSGGYCELKYDEGRQALVAERFSQNQDGAAVLRARVVLPVAT